MKFTIGELAKKTKLSADAIRFYEKRKLIAPAKRAENNYRYYDEDSLTRLTFIRHCRELGMSLKEIEALHSQLQHPLNNCAEVKQVITDHLQHVEEKIAQLEVFKTQLAQLKNSCHSDETIQACQIIQALQRSDEEQAFGQVTTIDLH
ncbi:MerR family transcriptional regulator [Acinetobacter nectaris]|uniref:MerR family transcriptional regulator n=1 Tax=Acinetobacter nectaris TaxID=1219382 RepID=UPI001F021C03|nr:MerR family transcriptional regulator [Acinetobacter nectaris]MCF9033696.1 MerR family transcriptional regulator [Acinetobacter nectaris]